MNSDRTLFKGWQRILLLILPYLFVTGIFSFFSLFIADVDIRNVRNARIDTNIKQDLVITFFNFLATLLVILFFVRFIDNERFIDIGLRLKNKVKDVFIGLFLGFIIMASAIFFLILSEEIVYKNIFIDIEKIFYMILLYIIVSLTEEILFRGYILRNFMYSFNRPTALILSSLLFSIAHGLNPNYDFHAFSNLFLAGILLGISYTYTKNLWFPIALHFSWNFFQSLFGFNVSGLNFYSLIEFSIPEPNIINGGKFGFEGSILSIIVQLFLILAIFIWYKRKAIREAQT